MTVELSLLPQPLPIAFPRASIECVYCPGTVHKGFSGQTHAKREMDYHTDYLKWTQDAELTMPTMPEILVNDEKLFDSTVKAFKHGLQLCTPPPLPSSPAAVAEEIEHGTCALIGISLTSHFDEAHLVETLAYAAKTCDKVRIVIIVDPYLSSTTQRELVKVGAWGAGLSCQESLAALKNTNNMISTTKKLIMQKMRIVRRWVRKVCNEELSAASDDIPLTGGPRFAWIQWADVVALPLYQKIRKAIGDVFNADSDFHRQVMSIAHHPVHEPTDAQTAEDMANDALLLPHEVELFTDYFLSEHAFLACLPTWFGCPGDRILLPYHCASRALPFLMSPIHIDPVGLELVDAVYSHTNIGLAVLPTQSSIRRTKTIADSAAAAKVPAPGALL
jgi:hypothetical protein